LVPQPVAQFWATISVFGLAADLVEDCCSSTGTSSGSTADNLRSAEYLFVRYGGVIVFCGRFVAFLRVYAAILAGANRFRPLDFAIYNAAGGLVWATVFGLGGYLIGKNAQHFLGPLGWLGLASFAIGGYFLWSFCKTHEERFLAEAERALAARKTMHRDV